MSTATTAHPDASMHGAPAQATSEQASKPRGRKGFAILGVVVAALLASIGGYAFATRNLETTDDAQVESDVVSIAARTSAPVLRVVIRENQAVKKGDVILELDSAEHAAKLAQAKAELATAEAQLDAANAQEQVVEATAKGGLHSAKAMVSGSSVAISGANADIAEAQAGLDRAQAEAKKEQLELERTKALFDSHAVSQEQLDNAQIGLQAAQAALAQANARLIAAKDGKRAAESRFAEAQGKLAQSAPIDAQIATAHAATELAKARVQAAEAAEKLAELSLSYTKIVAPDDGVVSKLSAHEGQLVSVGSPVAELVPRHAYVVANFKETQIGRMHAGEKADIAIDAFPGRKLEGRVESLSSGTGSRFSLLPPDNASGNFVKVVQRVPVRIELVNPPADVPLRAGLSADVTVRVGE